MSKRVVASLKSMAVSVIVMLIVALIGQVVVMALGGDDESMQMLRGPKKVDGVALTAHEASIATSLVKPGGVGVSMDDIGGLDSVKEDVRSSVVLPLQAPEAFFGGIPCLDPPRGVLLVGPPGTGKTMLARAIASEARVNLLSLTLSAMENKYVGESGKLVAAAFSLASKLQPCVLFFDEIDGMMRERTADEAGSSYGLKTEFLMNLDRWQQRPRDAVVVIGSTNNAKVLDPALKRRLPKTYTLLPPTAPERGHILGLLLRREPPGGRDLPADCLHRILTGTEGITGSDLGEIYREAGGTRLRRQMANPGFARVLRENPSEAVIEPISAADWDGALSRFRAQKQSARSNFCMREDASSVLRDFVSSVGAGQPAPALASDEAGAKRQVEEDKEEGDKEEEDEEELPP